MSILDMISNGFEKKLVDTYGREGYEEQMEKTKVEVDAIVAKHSQEIEGLNLLATVTIATTPFGDEVGTLDMIVKACFLLGYKACQSDNNLLPKESKDVGCGS